MMADPPAQPNEPDKNAKCDTDDKAASRLLNNGNSNNSNNDDGYVDITSVVNACAESLSFSNPMLCTESFSLQDSMAAMELLDRKMDSCEIPASQIQQGTRTTTTTTTTSNCTTTPKQDEEEPVLYPRPPPTELDDEFMPLPWNDLTLKDAVLIAVETLVRLESMLGGSSVVESIYTCLYAHASVIEDMKARLDMNMRRNNNNNNAGGLLSTLLQPATATTSSATTKTDSKEKEEGEECQQQPLRGTLPQHIVYASTLAMVEITEVMRSIILHGDIYEEEDFCANTYNVAVYSNREKGSTMNELTYALKLAEEELRLPSSSSSSPTTTTDDERLAAKNVLNFLIELLEISSTVVRKKHDYCTQFSSFGLVVGP